MMKNGPTSWCCWIGPLKEVISVVDTAETLERVYVDLEGSEIKKGPGSRPIRKMRLRIRRG